MLMLGFVLVGFHVMMSGTNVRQAFNFWEIARDVETSLLKTRIPDTTTFHKSYDFIIVGAGSAGCVLANRLSELANYTVLVLEAGDQETFLTDIPLSAAATLITRYNWGYKTEPSENACRGLRDGVCQWPKGRGVGGSSLINFLIYTRGQRQDYDHWWRLGNKGWSYREVLPYFKKSEFMQISELAEDSKYHGDKGELCINYSDYTNDVLKAFLKSGLEMGYNITDPNGEQLKGFNRAQATLQWGRRCSTSKAFIKPILQRRNLHISMKSWVTKILFEPPNPNGRLRASGVEFIKNHKSYKIEAKREIILSAGSIASPQLLMLSGIGPKENLDNLNITVLKDLKVGYNLQDHVSLMGLVFTTNVSTVNQKLLSHPLSFFEYLLKGRGPYTLPGGAAALGFVQTPSSLFKGDFTNMEIVLGAGSIGSDSIGIMKEITGLPMEFYYQVFQPLQGQNVFDMVPVLLRPRSRGRISLRSRSPFEWPKMEANFLQHSDDMTAMIEGIGMILNISQTKAMREINVKFNEQPFWGCEHLFFGSRDYWRCCLRLYATSLQHQVGTCKMGPPSDRDAVVDAQLLVHGIDNLRVADASIMPTIPAGHINAVVIMIAEKAADLIRKSLVP